MSGHMFVALRWLTCQQVHILFCRLQSASNDGQTQVGFKSASEQIRNSKACHCYEYQGRSLAVTFFNSQSITGALHMHDFTGSDAHKPILTAVRNM